MRWQQVCWWQRQMKSWDASLQWCVTWNLCTGTKHQLLCEHALARLSLNDHSSPVCISFSPSLIIFLLIAELPWTCQDFSKKEILNSIHHCTHLRADCWHQLWCHVCDHNECHMLMFSQPDTRPWWQKPEQVFVAAQIKVGVHVPIFAPLWWLTHRHPCPSFWFSFGCILPLWPVTLELNIKANKFQSKHNPNEIKIMWWTG